MGRGVGLHERRWQAKVAALAAALVAVGGSGCGSENQSATAQEQLEALSAPERTAGVELATDNNALSVMAPSVYPEVRELLRIGAGGNEKLIAALSDPKLDGGEDGDRVRALVAFVLEQNRASAAVPALRAHLLKSMAAPERAFFSMQAAAHALAVLSGQSGLVKSLYGLDIITSLLTTGSPGSALIVQSALVVQTTRRREILHEHLIGPKVPPAWYKTDHTPSNVARLREFWETKDDGLAMFEDPILVVEDATWSFDCHSWTFRRDDTRLPDLTQRYHILGEAVPTILEDEGYLDVTAVPEQWSVTDVVVFYKTLGGVPTHTGRLSSVGKGLTDANLRFTSKWSVSHPTVNVSVRDCSKLYGKIVKIWKKVEQCVVELRAGGQSTCARRSDGTVWCWGSNQSGQLGDGTTTDREAPVEVQGLTGAVGLTLGHGHACAVKGDGSAWCWGNNEYQQLGDGTKTDRPTPVAVAGLGPVAQVAAAVIETCAREQGGGVLCWGKGSPTGAPSRKTRIGPAPNNPPPPLVAVDLSSGFGGFTALTSDGVLWGWDGRFGGFPGNCLSNWTAGTSDAANPACPATTNQGMLMEPPSLLTGATRAAAIGRLHACAVLGGGVTCWGTNEHGQLGRTTSSPLFNYPGAVVGLAGTPIDLAAGENTGCARHTDGAVWCWGEQPNGMDSSVAVKVMGLTPLPTATSLGMAAGDDHSCALGENGVYCWGSNLFGALGTGESDSTLTRSLEPRRVALPCPMPAF